VTEICLRQIDPTPLIPAVQPEIYDAAKCFCQLKKPVV
jgi:hypothetical protein